MAPQRQARCCHSRRRCPGPRAARAAAGCLPQALSRRQQRQRAFHAGHLPHGVMPMSRKAAQRIGCRQSLQIVPVRPPRSARSAMESKARTARAASSRVAPSLDKCFTKRSPRRNAGRPSSRRSSVQSQSLDAASTARTSTPWAARVAHQLGRRIKAHRLAVDEGRAKCRRFVVLEPGGGIDQQREAGGVRFRKAVFAEPQYLIEYLMRETLGIAPLAHAVDQLALERLQAALALPGRHRAAQPIRLARRKAGCDDRQLHDLLLKNRHSQGALEHRLDLFAGIGHRFLAAAAAQSTDAPSRLESGPGARSPLRSPGRSNFAAAGAAAWTFAPAIRFETHPWCRRGKSSSYTAASSLGTSPVRVRPAPRMNRRIR